MVQIDTTTGLEDREHGCPRCRSPDWRLIGTDLQCRNCQRTVEGVLHLESERFVPQSELEFVGPGVGRLPLEVAEG